MFRRHDAVALLPTSYTPPVIRELRTIADSDRAAFVAVSFLYFFTLFGPKTLVGNVDVLAVACVLSVLLWWRLIPRAITTAEFWFTGLAAGYILLVIALAGVPDLWWGMKPPRVLLNYVGVFVCVTYSLQRFGRQPTLLMFHNAVFAHAVIVLAMAFSPSFKMLIASLFGGVTKSTFQISGLTRGLALTSIVMMFPFVTYPLFAAMEHYREKGIALKLLTILAATFFMGRTGFYLCLALAAFVVGAFAISGRVTLRRGLATAAMLTAVSAGVLFSVMPEESWLARIPVAQRLVQPIRHTFEPLANYRAGRGFTVASVTHITSMPIVYHNETVVEVLFGTGLYGRGDPWTYLPTDVAYLHMFSAFGVIGVALMCLAYVVSLPRHADLMNRPVYWATAAIILITLIANFKETALFTRHIYTVHVTLLAWLAHERWTLHGQPGGPAR